MGSITLITGGARSGKSSFALKLAEERYHARAFIATARAFDEEMRLRIRGHQSERADRFATIEEPLDIPTALDHLEPTTEVAVIDCITVLLGNLFYEHGDDSERISNEITRIRESCIGCRTDIIAVTNEVGSGIVPDNALARSFRDIAGRANQSLASAAEMVYLCVSGIPVLIKGKAR